MIQGDGHEPRRERAVVRDPVSSKPASPTPWRDFGTLAAVTLTLCFAVALTLLTIDAPVAWERPANASPLGYTVSLILFLAPIGMLAWWFFRHPEIRFARRAFWWTVGLLTPLGLILDFLLATTLFCFDALESTLGWPVRVLGGEVPVEELIFYLAGFLAVLLTYVWADEHWLGLYNVPDYRPAAERMGRILQFDWRALPLAGAVIVGGTIWSFTKGSGEPPIYLYFLTVAALLPTLSLLRSTIHFINWRAFSFTFFGILLVSLVWEVTLAAPYGWWHYDPRWMLFTIDGWWGLPVEAVLVWLVVTYTSVVVYEAIKIWLASGRSARDAWVGTAGSPSPSESRTI